MRGEPHGPRPPRRDRGRHPERELDELRRCRPRRRRHRPPRTRPQPALHPSGHPRRPPGAQERRQHRRHRAGRPGGGPPPARVRGPRVRGWTSRPRGAAAPGGSRRGSRLTARHNLPVLPRPPLPPGPYLVVGLARSGVAVARALRERGETVVGCDAGPVSLERGAELEAAGVAVHAGTSGLELLEGAGSLVKSPGVPAQAPVVAAARAAGTPVVGELEIGWRLVPNETIAVTGSNGKTTTVELIGHLHRTAGLAAEVVGNVGTALSTLAGTGLPAATTIVLEASSFQLEDSERFAPDAGVLLNLAEDHLDRHGTFEAYRAAKLEVFARQPPGTVAVAPEELAADELGGRARRVCFGAGPGARFADRAGQLWWDEQPLL